MARGDAGALVPAPALAPAPTPAQVYLPAWRRTYDRLVKMLRQAYAQAEELSVEREHLITELQFLQSGLREREEISQARLQQICKHEEVRKRAVEAETAACLGGKELQIHCYQKLAELAENDLEDFKSCILNLTAENTELKEKLKKFESQMEICTDNSDHQKSGKDIREEVRKLKKAYKILRSEKDKEISALQAKKNFVCNQLKTMEEDYRGAIKSKNIEVKQAQKLLQNVDGLQVASQKKDDEIIRLQVEVTNAKERMSILEDELQKMRSLVKDKGLQTDKNEDDQSDTSKMSKKDIHKANRKSKSTRTCQVTPDISRISQVTPDRQEVKTTRTCASETNQKRKRSCFKSSLSCVSEMSKKDIIKANRKSKSTKTSQVTPDISRTSQVTPDSQQVKTTRTCASETNQKRKRSSFRSPLSCVSEMSKKDIIEANRKSKSTKTSQVTPDRREVKTTRTRASERLRLIRSASIAPSSPPCRV